MLTGDGWLIRKVELPLTHHASLAISPDGKSIIATANESTVDGSSIGRLLQIDNPVGQ